MSSDRKNPAATQRPPEGGRSHAPDWITDELIADTISTWQPHYDFDLTEHDAIEMLVNVGRLFDLLEADHDHPRPRKLPRNQEHD
ncbi:MAG: hypothetical protein AAGH88_09130 [Planctomycetota bacterium]